MDVGISRISAWMCLKLNSKETLTNTHKSLTLVSTKHQNVTEGRTDRQKCRGYYSAALRAMWTRSVNRSLKCEGFSTFPQNLTNDGVQNVEISLYILTHPLLRSLTACFWHHRTNVSQTNFATCLEISFLKHGAQNDYFERFSTTSRLKVQRVASRSQLPRVAITSRCCIKYRKNTV